MKYAHDEIQTWEKHVVFRIQNILPFFSVRVKSVLEFDEDKIMALKKYSFMKFPNL